MRTTLNQQPSSGIEPNGLQTSFSELGSIVSRPAPKVQDQSIPTR
jgi:hypothetical protein